MGLITRGIGAAIKGFKSNKKASGSYFLTDPSPKVIVKDPDTIKLNKQIKRIKQGAAVAVGAMGGAAVYRKFKNKKDKK